MRICHLINDLDAGGAEVTLLNLLRSIPAGENRQTVISLLAGGTLVGKFRRTGHRILEVGMGRSFDLHGLWRLFALIREEKPDILHAWMYHSNLLGLVVGKLAGARRIVISLHHAKLDARVDRKTTILVAYAGALLSRGAAAVVCCAEQARQEHLRIGYPAHKLLTIYNGIDTERFAPAPGARGDHYRRRLQVTNENLLIAMIGRYHPVKNHSGFLQAAAMITQKAPAGIRGRIRFVLAGSGAGEDNRELVNLAVLLGIRQRVLLLGHVADVQHLLPHLDLLVSSSHSEAFPLNVGEAMASGVPCVVTDVGDSAFLVGKTGLVVAPGNPRDLAVACLQLIRDPRGRKELGRAARQRVEALFSLRRMTREYQHLYERIAS